MKIDPYNHKEKYLSWKENINGKLPGVSEKNSEVILRYIFDMEQGINISTGSKKGARSHIRLNTLKEKMPFFAKKFKEYLNLDEITRIKEEQLCAFFTKMRNGEIRRKDGKEFTAVSYYVKVFKAFWHWYQKVNRKKGITIPDITLDLDTREQKPKWVYLNEEQVKKLCDSARYDYKVLFTFLFDTGIRSPTELVNIKISDLYNNCKEVQIREEVSKTFGRRIKLMISSDLIKEYIKRQGLGSEDYLFSFG